MHRLLIAVALPALLAACSKPDMPDKDKPVEPQARHDDLARAMHKPLQQATAARAATEAAAKAQDAALDAAADGVPTN